MGCSAPQSVRRDNAASDRTSTVRRETAQRVEGCGNSDGILPAIAGVDRDLARLYYLLLVTGIEHDDQTARAPLPRTLSLWKDLEERNRDKIFLAELSDKLKQTAATRFKGQFEIDQLEVVDSQGNPFVQLADLFTSSINRTVNSDSQRDHPKDRFAEYFLRQIGMSRELQQELRQDDIVAHIRL